MGTVVAFGTLSGTINAGMTAYYRAPDGNELTIADILPVLSKITTYANEYIIGEMLIWDTGSQSSGTCAMVRVIIYNDGWICAWLDKTDTNQIACGGAQYVDSLTLEGWGSGLEYEDRWNNCILKINASTDPDCPTGTCFPIGHTDHINGRISVYSNSATSESFHTGYSYGVDIYMTNGNIMWWGRTPYGITAPPTNSNRLYRAIYQIWCAVKSSSNSINWSPANASLVWMYDSQLDTYTNETTDFNDAETDDCQVLPSDDAVNDAFYIGWSAKFNGVTFTMGVMGIGSGVTWEYWGGGPSWETLTCTDGSSGFTATGELTFTPPDSWCKTLVNGDDYYWIRARVTTATYSTTPILTQGQLYSQRDIGYLETELGLWDFEFSSANYLMLSGRTCNAGREINIIYHYYNTVLPGKVIYDYVGLCAHKDKYVGYAQIWINGNRIFYHSSSDTIGFLPFDFTGYDYSSGIQNVIKLSSYGSNNTAEYCHCSSGTVLICS